VQTLSNFIYSLAFLDLLSLIRVVSFLHRQPCPLGNTISEREHSLISFIH